MNNAYLAELQSSTTETEYQITSSGPTIRNQKITKQGNTVYMTAGFVTTGQGGANTRYNLGTIPEDIRVKMYPQNVDGTYYMANRDAHTAYIGEIVAAYMIR